MFTVDIISMVALFRHKFTDTLQVVSPYGAKDKRMVLPLVNYFINTRECSGFHVFAPHHQDGGVRPVSAHSCGVTLLTSVQVVRCRWFVATSLHSGLVSEFLQAGSLTFKTCVALHVLGDGRFSFGSTFPRIRRFMWDYQDYQ